ncbi:MAG: NAD(P)-dependent oxidoreductase [Tissierella sp.]|uniref:NAD(P)-dependent oxidoreductase n=1 Tax=Tissierella sp. TaxID=41274 RepID=UPI003F997C88
MLSNITNENNRCLQCKNPFCEDGCPVDTPIKEVIGLLKENKIKQAGEMLFENNPLSVITGLICPHEDFCEGHCILNRKGNPIQFGSIEHYVSNYYLKNLSFDIKADPNKKVGIIGSGPAGLTMAIILAKKGYDITIFEAHEKIGGVLRHGIPEFRLPNDILDRYHELLINMGVKIRPNTVVGPVLSIDDLFRDGYKSIFVATGTWKPRKLNIKGESLGNVYYAIDYLRSPLTHNLGEKVCIIGGGNVALDSARTALRNGAKDVKIFYRRSEEEMPSSENEIKYAKFDGVKFEFNKTPKEIKDNCVYFADTENILNEDGKPELKTIEDSGYCYEADSTIVSISQGPKTNIVDSAKDIKLNRLGLVIIDSTGKTTREGVFASGDVVTGAKTVVEAVAAAKLAAKTIEDYIEEKYNL